MEFGILEKIIQKKKHIIKNTTSNLKRFWCPDEQNIDWFSNHNLFLDEFSKTSISIGLPYQIEKSKGGDFHIWVFFDEPTDAKIVRTFFRDYVLLIGEKASLPFEFMKKIEVFPKQESLSSTGQYGSMVWLPFYGGVDDIGDGAQNGNTIFVGFKNIYR